MIYVHVPFCKSFCIYCGFYSELCNKDNAFASYCEGVCREIEARREEILASASPRTLYFGGGTPSVLPLKYLRRIVEALPGGYEEFTVEANPDDITPEYASALAGMGVNRISLGVQSFDDGILRWMNRRHDAAQAVRAIEIIREAGIENISIDLIFGFPLLTDEIWNDTLRKALALRPQHISAYQLSVEEGSALDEKARSGAFAQAGEEQCRSQYDTLCRLLSEAGYRHYEVSNFALPGYEAVHNGAYWARAPYVGLGPGAHSFDGRLTRSWNTQALTGWHREQETLTMHDEAVEKVMLALRTADGMPESDLLANANPEAVSALLQKGALIKIRNGRLRIAENHFFVSDDIISSLITTSS